MARRIAVITGVSKGLGAALASALVARGFDVVGIGRSAAPELRGDAFRLVVADLADAGSLPSKLEPLFAGLAEERPEAIVVVNNAATAAPAATVGAILPTQMAESFAVNIEAPVLVADAFVRAFAGVRCDRRLVNVSSGAAASAIPGAGIYCMSKAALEMLTAVTAAEHARSGIVAITLRPGIIDTPMQAFMRSRTSGDLPSVEMFKTFHASGQLVAPQAVARKVVERLVVGRVTNGRTYAYDEL